MVSGCGDDEGQGIDCYKCCNGHCGHSGFATEAWCCSLATVDNIVIWAYNMLMVNTTERKMKRALIVAGFLFASISSAQAVQCVVQGYYKSNGTWVNSYVREQTSCKTTQYAGGDSWKKMAIRAGAVFLVVQVLGNMNKNHNAKLGYGLDEGDIENIEMNEGEFQCPVGQSLVETWTREKGTVSSCQ